MKAVDYIKHLELERDNIKKYQKTIPEKTFCYELLDLKIAFMNLWIEILKSFVKR